MNKHIILFFISLIVYIERDVISSIFEETTFIRVSRDILFKNDVRFSHEVANRRDGALLTFSEASKVMDFEVL